jgi:hypothetical protein
MKKLIPLCLVILFSVCSCSPNINGPLFAKSGNAKVLFQSKYGNPSKVENQLETEKWIYEYSSPFKSNRTVVFDKSGKIILHKKHYKDFHMITGFNKYGYITVGATLLLFLVNGPFPALL